MNTNNLYSPNCFPNPRIRGAKVRPCAGWEYNGSDTRKIVRAVGNEGKYLSGLGFFAPRT